MTDRREQRRIKHRSRRAATLVLALATASSRAPAAEEETLITDRPDFTESAASVDPRRVQLELGYTFEGAGDTDVESLGEVLVRIGWTESLELRLGVNSYVTSDSPAGENSGFEDASIGVKIELADEAETPRLMRPQLAVLLGTSLPTGSSKLGSDDLQPGAILALAWTLSDRLSLGSNVGATWVSDDGEQSLEGVLSFALGAALGGDWGGFVEYYAIVPESSAGGASQFVDAGLTRLLTDDFQLDLRVGTEIGGETDFFVGAGLAYRW